MYNNTTDDSDLVGSSAFIGSFEKQEKILDLFMYGRTEQAYAPTTDSVTKAKTVSGTDKNVSFSVADLNVEELVNKYNNHIYQSKTADINGSYFKIGPLTYGGEVQDIKILESKAIASIQGARSGSDFLTDDGSGDADISVTLIFSGKSHIINGLLPLIALMRISPISSVKNKIIEASLYNKFTENAVAQPDNQLINKLNKVLTTSVKIQENQKVLRSIGVNDRDLVTLHDFLKAQALGVESVQNKTFEQWSKEINDIKYFQPGPNDLIQNTNPNKVLNELDKSRSPIKHIDKTGHVPVAIMNMTVSTHPEFKETLVVNLMLKRIGVQNFLRDFLQYRDIAGNPTPDATKAFWLNRAISLYINQYYSSSPEILFSDSAFHLVNLKFDGDELLLKHFKYNNGLSNLVLSADDYTRGVLNRTPGTSGKFNPEGIVVTQLSYSVGNKFAFHRLAGESYPTAQHMGFNSGSLTIAVKTNDHEKFEQIHTYKSAADFFVRSADRADRFNGWQVDCILTRLFNSKQNPFAKSDNNFANTKLFYPLNIASATTDMPQVRDVVMSLAETTTEFFSEFGFVLIGNGLTVENMKQFYDSLFDKLLPGDNGYSNYIILGSGNSDEKFSIINPSSIIAALVEKDKFTVTQNENTGTSYGSWTPSPSGSGRKILEYLLKNNKFSGQHHSTNNGFELFFDEVNEAIISSLSSITLPDTITKEVVNDNFVQGSVTAEQWNLIVGELTKRISRLVSEDGPKEIYEYIFQQYNAKALKFSDNFLDHLFASIVKRSIPPLHDSLYERLHVANAYDTLERAIYVNGEEIDANAFSDFARSKAVDNAIVYDPDGALQVSKRRITAYPDYFYLTFKDLFSLSEFPIDYWKKFAYTYQDLGIINPDIKDYSIDQSRGLDMYVTSRAQSELVTTESSPIPPSIFFYRERELNDFRNNLDSEYQEWFNTLKTLTISVPYDIDFILTQAGKITGNRGVIPDGKLTHLDQLSSNERLGLASILEAQNKYIREKAKISDSIIKESGEDIIVAQFKKAKSALGFGSLTDRQFYNKIEALKKNDPHSAIIQEYNKYLDGDKFEAFVPVVYTSHRDDEVASYRKVSGTVGAIVYKDIFNRAAEVSNTTRETFLGDVLLKNAAGFDDGISISNSSTEECYNGVLKLTQGIPDNRNDLIKAFPVYRLYLVDYNKGDRVFVKDNFYGYNSILSIDITLDKNDADLAQIRIADPLQILQSSTFTDKIVWNKGAIGGLTLPNSPDESDRDNFLSRFELRQGRAIQIRGGYSADPDNLDILFTGRIAEVQFGDVVTVIAQGWKAELLGKQVDFELTSVDNSSVKDLVTRTIRDANPAGLGTTYSQEELNKLVPYRSKVTLDGAIFRSIQNQYGTFGGDSGNSGFEGFFGLHFFGNAKQGLDLRLKNIWAPDNDKTRFNPLADITTTGWEGESWLIPMQPAWDVLQSATNYIWGYICQVVPYDGEATLFFGRPDQLYYYTKGNFKESTEYRKLHLKTQETFSSASRSVFNDFVSSPFFNGGSLIQFLSLPELADYTHSSWNISNFKETDYFTLPIKLRSINKENEFSPDQCCLRSYFFLASTLAGYDNSTNLNLGLRSFRLASLYNNEITDLLSKNLSKDFYKTDFKVLSSAFGGDANAAWFTFLSFYGFSEYFVNNYLSPLTGVVSQFLGRFNQQTVNSVKELLLNRLPNSKEINFASNFSNPRNESLRGVDLTQYITYLKKLSPEQAGKFSISLTSYNSDTLLASFKIKSNSDLDSQVSEADITNYLNAIGLYLSIKPSMRDIATSIASLNCQVSGVSSASERLLGGIALVASLSNTTYNDARIIQNNLDSGALQTLRANIIRYFESVLQAEANSLNEVISIFDPKYIAHAKRLNLISLIDSKRSIEVQDLVQYIVDGIPMYRAYVHWLSLYVKDAQTAISGENKDHIVSLSNTNAFKFPPALNMKPFRDYHYVSSGVEIVENNIGASTREMYNAVVIRGPKNVTTDNDSWFKLRVAQGDYDSVAIEDLEWQTWPNETEEHHIGWQFNDSLSLENKKLTVYTDLNARRRDQAAKIATNVMAKSLRPMYRNNLLLLGRSIKPWDQIHLDDKYQQMWGPIEVERVVHHYSVKTGWLTNIVPHAVVEANPGNSAVQRSVIANKFDKIYNIVDYTMWGIVILTAIPTLGASIGVATPLIEGTTSLAARTLPSIFGRQGLEKLSTSFINKKLLSDRVSVLGQAIFENAPPTIRSYLYTQAISEGAGEITRIMAMNSMSGPIQAPVTICPLLYKGIPFEAGLNGRETAYYSLASKIYWTYRDLQKGLDNVGSFLTDTLKTPNPSATNIFLESDSRIKRP